LSTARAVGFGPSAEPRRFCRTEAEQSLRLMSAPRLFVKMTSAALSGLSIADPCANGDPDVGRVGDWRVAIMVLQPKPKRVCAMPWLMAVRLCEAVPACGQSDQGPATLGRVSSAGLFDRRTRRGEVFPEWVLTFDVASLGSFVGGACVPRNAATRESSG